MKKSYIFQLEMMVRDYECDIQGIVNNANYLHFMEHTRHPVLLTFIIVALIVWWLVLRYRLKLH